MKYILRVYDVGYVIGSFSSYNSDLIYARVIKNTSGLTFARVGELWYFDTKKAIIANSIAEIEKKLVFQ